MNAYAPVRHPDGRRAQTVSRPVRADVRDFSAVAGVADSSVQIQAALDSGATEITLGNAGTYRAALTIPAGVTLLSSGAKLRPVASVTARYVLTTGGVGACMQGITFDGSSDSGLLGGELFIKIQHASTRVLGNRFLGTGYRYGVLVQADGGGVCDDGEISDNVFTGTGAAIYKQGGDTSAHRFKYNRNRFASIARGDAIELNLGNDVGFEVVGNIIDGVTGNGLPNAGLGIGIAGSGAYGGPESGQHRHFRVADNWVRNTEAAAIHLEVSARGLVTRNTVIRDSGAPAGVGIEVFGSTRIKVAENTVTGFTVGIRNEVGTTAGSFAASSDKNTIENNDVDDCTTGVYDGTAGTRMSSRVARNRITACGTGIKLHGAADLAVVANRITDCPVPLDMDLAPTTKGSINSSSPTLLIESNTATSAGLPQAHGVAVANASGTVIRERGNSFWLGAAASTKYDYHQPGDLVADGTDQLVCLTAGWKQKNASQYFVTAVAGNNYVKVVSPAGDPTAGLVAGQAITLTGMGPAGADLVAVIRRIYTAAPDYRLEIDGVIGTTVAVSTAIALTQTATYALLAFGPGSDQWLKEVGGSFDFALLVPSATDGTTGLPTASTARWPDGTSGAFTGTVDTSSGTYSGWVITWVGATTRTLTVTGMTSDVNGNRLGPTSLVVS